MSGDSDFRKSRKPFFMQARIPFTFQEISFMLGLRVIYY